MAREHECECKCPKCTGLCADPRLHQESGGGRDKITTAGTLKLSQVTCKHKELPACHLVSKRAGRPTKRFKQDIWKLAYDTAFGTHLPAKSLSGPLTRANPWVLTAGQTLADPAIDGNTRV